MNKLEVGRKTLVCIALLLVLASASVALRHRAQAFIVKNLSVEVSLSGYVEVYVNEQLVLSAKNDASGAGVEEIRDIVLTSGTSVSWDIYWKLAGGSWEIFENNPTVSKDLSGDKITVYTGYKTLSSDSNIAGLAVYIDGKMLGYEEESSSPYLFQLKKNDRLKVIWTINVMVKDSNGNKIEAGTDWLIKKLTNDNTAKNQRLTWLDIYMDSGWADPKEDTSPQKGGSGTTYWFKLDATWNGITNKWIEGACVAWHNDKTALGNGEYFAWWDWSGASKKIYISEGDLKVELRVDITAS